MKTFQVSGNRDTSFGVPVPLTRRMARAACLAVGLSLSSSVAFADPVLIVQFGGVHTGGDDTGFNPAGAGFEFMASEVLGPIVTCEPCVPGTALDLSATLTVQDWPAGRAMVDGRTYESVFFSGAFDFDAGSVIVPAMPPGSSEPGGEGLARAFSTFTFTGTLAGFADPGLTGTPLFSVDLAGGGIVRAAFENLSAETGVRVYQLDYAFENAAAPVPEPGSLLLFGSGTAWVVARRRKARSASVV